MPPPNMRLYPPAVIDNLGVIWACKSSDTFKVTGTIWVQRTSIVPLHDFFLSVPSTCARGDGGGGRKSERRAEE